MGQQYAVSQVDFYCEYCFAFVTTVLLRACDLRTWRTTECWLYTPCVYNITSFENICESKKVARDSYSEKSLVFLHISLPKSRYLNFNSYVAY